MTVYAPGGNGGGSGTPQITTLDVDVAISHSDAGAPTIGNLTGTVHAITDEYDLEVYMHGYAGGAALAPCYVLYGDVAPVGDPNALRDHADLIPPALGVEQVDVGGGGFDETAQIARRVRVTGLAPGTTYTWALQTSIFGGAQFLDLGAAAGPYKLVILPDDSKTYLACNSGHVAVVRNGGRPGLSRIGEPWPNELLAVIATSAGTLYITVTPDGSRVLAVNTTAATVTIIDTVTDTVTFTTVAIANINGKEKKIIYRILACVACPMKTPAGMAVRAQGSSVEQCAQFSFQDPLFRFWLKFPFPTKVLSYY